MDWEKVKGFARRQTQAVKEKMNDAPHTVDPAFNEMVEGFVNLRLGAKGVEQKLQMLESHLSAANQIICDLGQSLSQGHQNEEVLVYARKLDIFKNESANRMASLSATFKSCIGELAKFGNEANQLEMLLDDRRDKVLEYDFFRNKLESLRASPPSDTGRIPRNEHRMNEWKAKYDDITNRTVSFMGNSRIGAESAILHSAVAVCNEYGKYLEEIARGARAVLISDGSMGVAYAARQVAHTAYNAASGAATSAAAAVTSHIPQQIPQKYHSPTQQVPPTTAHYQQQQAAPQQPQAPPPAPVSNRNKRDDPFAL